MFLITWGVFVDPGSIRESDGTTAQHFCKMQGPHHVMSRGRGGSSGPMINTMSPPFEDRLLFCYLRRLRCIGFQMYFGSRAGASVRLNHRDDATSCGAADSTSSSEDLNSSTYRIDRSLLIFLCQLIPFVCESRQYRLA